MPSFLDRIMLLPSALLALTLSCALAAADSSNTASPISIPPSQQWDGIDGSWSSFIVKIGTPAQEVRTFVSWNGYQTWAVIPEGCQSASDYEACAQARGGIFNQSASRTWEEKGLYSLAILQDLGYYGNAYYGFDVVELGNTGPTLTNSTVAGFALEDFYLGVLGINPKPTNFTWTSTSPSYMSQLKEDDKIPSISFGYTAGASYRENDTVDPYASLTLGGYDTTKFVSNDLTWKFAADNSRDIVVALQSVNTPSQIESSPVPTEMLPDPIYIYLDATVPQIWLPIDSCYVFEYEFGLTYDNVTDLYVVNNTLHQQLLNRNASITFQLAIEKDGGNVVSIELPYAAFDLTARAPYQGVQEDTFYFPLRRAVNESQYTLGRAFFQEAYIIVDYESQQFNVSQRVWQDNTKENVVTIPALADRSAASYPGVAPLTKSSSGLSGGAIAGIVVGIVAVLAIIATILWFLIRRRRRAARQRALENEKLTNVSDAGSDEHGGSSSGHGTESIVIPKAELPGSQPLSQHDSQEQAYLASGALSTHRSSSPSDFRTPRNRNALSGQTFVHGRWNGEPYSPATDSQEEGTQTHSSTYSQSHGTGSGSNSNYGGTGTGTLMSLVSPLSPADSNEASDRSGFAGPSELAGDMPPVKEKDGKELSEKEALAYREKKYNGVEDPPSPINPRDGVGHAATSRETPARVRPEDVVRAGTVGTFGGLRKGRETRDMGLHERFSFEEEREGDGEGSEEDLYKP